jgi:hypothetical protein
MTQSTTSQKESERMGAVDLAKHLKDRCKPLTHPANDLIGGALLPQAVHDILDTVINGQFAPSIALPKWEPPEFATIRQYIRDDWGTNVRGYELGDFNGISIRGVMSGGVECEGPPSNNLCGPGAIIIEHPKSTKEFISAIVVGRVAGTGTAIILDSDRDVYLFSPPTAIDPPLAGTTNGLVLISRRGNVLEEHIPIESVVLPNAIFKMKTRPKIISPEESMLHGLDEEDSQGTTDEEDADADSQSEAEE